MNRTADTVTGLGTRWFRAGHPVLYSKRLETDTFRLPIVQDQSIILTYSELSLLPEGPEAEVKSRRKFEHALENDPIYAEQALLLI